MGGGPDLQEEVQDAEKPEAGRYGCWEYQEARLEFYQMKTDHCLTGQ